MSHDFFRQIIDFIISIIFFAAAFMKVRNFFDFKIQIFSYGYFRKLIYLPVVAFLIIIVELMIFLIYSLGKFHPVIDVITILILVMLSIQLILKVKTSKELDCGCFGDIHLLNKYPITRNLILIFLLIINIFLNYYSQSNETYNFIGNGLIVVCILLSYEIMNIVLKIRSIKNSENFGVS